MVFIPVQPSQTAQSIIYNIYKKRRSRKWAAKGFINPLAGGVRGVTPYSVGRCHEVTEGTGDRWEQSPPPDKTVNQAQR